MPSSVSVKAADADVIRTGCEYGGSMTNQRDGNSGVVNSGGAELRYVREGKGPPISRDRKFHVLSARVLHGATAEV